MANYVVTLSAERDIDEILRYIAIDDLDAAIAFFDRLIGRFEMLAENPKAGRDRTELKHDLRSFPEGNYLVFYREWAGIVGIVRVLHGARDLDALFG